MSSSAEGIAKQLTDGNVSVDYVFYYAYMQPDSDEGAMTLKMAEELMKANVPPFQNFLQGLRIAKISPKRILL
jgi:hypothetical protein